MTSYFHISFNSVFCFLLSALTSFVLLTKTKENRANFYSFKSTKWSKEKCKILIIWRHFEVMSISFYNKLYPNKIDKYQSKYFNILIWILEKLHLISKFYDIFYNNTTQFKIKYYWYYYLKSFWYKRKIFHTINIHNKFY